ncbi:enoyl-CoA hydratase/isomerase family protein [Xanthobacter sp. KR7-65]|uniref:enoyl-CoA hydratase/isomerase family protein n=1 Tax=Xanthobacter sp. KR7-65 TaxID=3156612 RepID=UPI0032B37F95
MGVRIEEQGNGVVVLNLVGQGEPNHLDTEALLDLAETARNLASHPGMRALVLTGHGANFCGGRMGKKGLTRASDVAEDLNAILKVNSAFAALPVPTVLAVEGLALGWGFGMSAQADYVIAAENARFALPEMSHGMPPLIVLSYLFRFVSYKRGFELALSSREISAADAELYGIVTRVVAPGRARAEALEVADFIAAQDPKSITLLRKFGREAAGLSDPQRNEYAVSLMSVLLAERAQMSHG